MAGLTNALVTGQNFASKDAVAVADIADPTTATAEDCANKINALLAELRANGLIKSE